MSSGSRLQSRPLSALLAAAVVGAGAVALATPAAAATGGVLVYGLTEANQIVQFRATDPDSILASSAPVALAAGEDLVGIDVRPLNGALYGVVDGAVDRVITIEPTTGAILTSRAISVQLPAGSTFGVDFNPMADRLRIVADTDASYNTNVDTGDVLVQGAINPADAVVRAVAYVNNVVGAGSTQLLDIDVAGADRLAQQAVATGALTYRGLTGVDVPEAATTTASVGFDIEAVTNAAYALLETGTGREALYSINTTTGAATRIGGFSSTSPVEDIAIASPRFFVDDTSANEGSNASVVVRRTGDLADTATVQLALTPGTATTADYTASTPTVTFAAGQASGTASIPLTADDAVEASETFTVTISTPAGPGGNASVSDATAVVTVLDGPGAPAPCTTAPRVVLGQRTITATSTTPVSVVASPNTFVELYAYTRPSTTYRLVRSGTTDADGQVAFAPLRPAGNTRLYAVERGCAANPQRDSTTLGVRTALTIEVTRTGTRTYVFSGDSIPARAGGLIVNLYRVLPDGTQVLAAQTRASSTTGEFALTRTFSGTGRFGFAFRVGKDIQNEAGSSNVRSLLIF